MDERTIRRLASPELKFDAAVVGSSLVMPIDIRVQLKFRPSPFWFIWPSLTRDTGIKRMEKKKKRDGLRIPRAINSRDHAVTLAPLAARGKY